MSTRALPFTPAAVIFDMDGLMLDSERAILESLRAAALDQRADIDPDWWLCLIGHTDKLGDKAYQQKLARAIVSGVRRHFHEAPPDGTLLATRKAGGKPLPAAKVRAEPDTRTASQSAATRTSGELRHQVQRGESLTQLAKRHNITMAALVKANNLRDHNIRIGQWLTIPGQPASATSSAAISSEPAVAKVSEQRHQVKSGESLGLLAKRHNTTVAALVKANRLRDQNIRIGQWLTIPGAQANAAAAQPKPVSRADLKHKVSRGESLTLLAKRYKPSWPSSMVAMVVTAALVWALNLGQFDIATLGAVGSGLPAFQMPEFPPGLMRELVLPALNLAMVSFVSMMLTARSFAAKNGYEIDADKEFRALGMANLASAVSQGFAISGADSRTAVNDANGGKSQLVSIIAAAVIALITFYLTAPLQFIPTAALGVVLVMASLSLTDFRGLWALRDSDRAAFWLALLVVMFFSLDLGWLPASGQISLLYDVPSITGIAVFDVLMSHEPWRQAALHDALRHLILPSLVLAVVPTTEVIRHVRSSLIDVMKQNYIKAAASRGLSRRQIVWRHGLKNALPPVLPLLGLQLGSVLTSAMITEVVFEWHGIGRWLINSIALQDYAAIRGATLVVAGFVIFISVSTELLTTLIYPARRKELYAKQD